MRGSPENDPGNWFTVLYERTILVLDPCLFLKLSLLTSWLKLVRLKGFAGHSKAEERIVENQPRVKVRFRLDLGRLSGRNWQATGTLQLVLPATPGAL